MVIRNRVTSVSERSGMVNVYNGTWRPALTSGTTATVMDIALHVATQSNLLYLIARV
jgi:hypothetical protein